MKAQITKIGTIDEKDVLIDWGFDCHGGTMGKDFIREDGKESFLGWSLDELKEIAEAAENCPLYKAGVLFR